MNGSGWEGRKFPRDVFARLQPKKEKKGKHAELFFLGEMLRFLFFSFFGDYFSTIG